MIKYETIISNFDDKVTLYNWLRKVEEALKNASATNFVVNKKGNATLSFSITFADGTTLESGDIVLQQGESVDDARIASGVLQLHLTNGTWLTAGNIKPVSNFSIDAYQHLIVNYQDGTSQDLGAIFNGNINIAGTLNATKITGNEIVETMTGYSFIPLTPANLTIENVYCGICKNGNKLTIVYAFNITPLASNLGFKSICQFGIPASVGSKLYPVQIGGYDYLSFAILNCAKTVSSVVSANSYLAKNSNVNIQLNFNPDTLNVNEKYYVRFEATFLLSDNLAE